MDAGKKLKKARRLLKEIQIEEIDGAVYWKSKYENLQVEYYQLQRQLNQLIPGGSMELYIAELKAQIDQRDKIIARRLPPLEDADGTERPNGPDLPEGQEHHGRSGLLP